MELDLKDYSDEEERMQAAIDASANTPKTDAMEEVLRLARKYGGANITVEELPEDGSITEGNVALLEAARKRAYLEGLDKQPK